jgi:integrase/recombinase XerD
MVLTVCYATGLRISEAVRLTPAAIDSQRMVIRVEQGKGRKDGSIAKFGADLGSVR